MSAPNDSNRFPVLEDMLSYFPALSPSNSLQSIRCPNLSLADHFKSLMPHRRSTPDSSRADSKLKPHVPQPPARGCPINDLPPEILSWIFVLGEEIVCEEEEEGIDGDEEDEEEEMPKPKPNEAEPGEQAAEEKLEVEGISEENGDDSEWEDEPEDEDEDDDGSILSPSLPFQVLVSHVCRYWRQVSTDTPSLWNCIDFSEGKPYERSMVYLERSKGYPLVIVIDCTEDDLGSDSSTESGDSSHNCADLEIMLSLVMPHVRRWASFHLTAEDYNHMHTTLRIFSTAPSAPLLESLEFYHYEEEAEGSMEAFTPAFLKTPFVLFNNDLPRLHSVTFWGVHIDWTNTKFLRNLIHLQLAYHSQDVRPTFQEFFNFLRASPSLGTLQLCLSGPAGDPAEWPTILPPPPAPEAEDADTLASRRVQIEEFLTLESLHDLSLEFDPPEYIMAILDRLYLPNLRDLSLNFEDHDYSAFVSYLASPAKHGGKKDPIISHLKSLKLVQLPCSWTAAKLLYDTLKNLEALRLNFNYLDMAFLDLLRGRKYPSGTDPAYASNVPLLPSLTSLAVSGLDASGIRRLVQDREDAGLPLKKLYVDEDSEIGGDDEDWFNTHVEEFSYFIDTDDELDEVLEREEDYWI